MPSGRSSQDRAVSKWSRIGLSCVFLLMPHAVAFAQIATALEPTIVRPTDRLAWRQAVPSMALAQAYVFAAYVDGELSYLRGTICEPAGDDELAVDCTAALPPLTEGRHQISITSLNNDQDRLESEPSAPVVVMLSRPSVASTPSRQDPITTTGALPGVLASGLDQPIDIAVLRTGLAVVAERKGRILGVHHDDQGRVRVQVWIDALKSDGELVAVAATGSHLFAVYAGGGTATLVRYTVEANGLTNRSILLDGLPVRANDPAVALRPGPDGKLYLALGADAGDAVTRNDVGSWQGKVLRLNADGTLPNDAPSVVFGASVSEPRDMTWHGSALWLLGMSDLGTATLTPVRPFWQTQGMTADGVSLPAAFAARSVVTLTSGDIIVGSPSHLLTMRMQSQGRLVAAAVDPSGLDGVIKVTTDLSRMYFLTWSELVVRPILVIR